MLQVLQLDRALHAAMHGLGSFGFHGATELPEGAVWRVERRGKYDFMAKYVRPENIDGCYLPEMSGGGEYWNWRQSREAVTA